MQLNYNKKEGKKKYYAGISETSNYAFKRK